MTGWMRPAAALVLGAFLLAAASLSPGYPAYERANALFAAKKFPESAAALDEALRLDPNLVPALTLKAKMEMAANQYGAAQQCLERALAVDPKSAYAQFLYGLDAYLSNDMKEALPRFQKARLLNPRDSHAALYLGLTSESLGQTAEALRLYEEAVSLETASSGLQGDTLLPGARLLLLLGRLDESERWARHAVKLSPQSRDAHFELARVLLKKDDASASAAEGETALTLSDGVTTDPAIHYLLIRAWQRSGSPDRAAFHAAVMRAQETSAAGPAKD